ncbi:Hypothetical protein ABZS17G119_01570 [Kosakonia cowanii]
MGYSNRWAASGGSNRWRDAACAIYNQMGTLTGSNIVLPPVQ